MRYSKQREVILDVVLNSCDHPDVKKIYKTSKKKIPNISLGTVYRNLNSLVDSGLIIRIPMKDKNDRFDKATQNHNHVYCERCGKLTDINLLLSQEELTKLENETGFKITNCNFNIKGICASCAKERNE